MRLLLVVVLALALVAAAARGRKQEGRILQTANLSSKACEKSGGFRVSLQLFGANWGSSYFALNFYDELSHVSGVLSKGAFDVDQDQGKKVRSLCLTGEQAKYSLSVSKNVNSYAIRAIVCGRHTVEPGQTVHFSIAKNGDCVRHTERDLLSATVPSSRPTPLATSPPSTKAKTASSVPSLNPTVLATALPTIAPTVPSPSPTLSPTYKANSLTPKPTFVPSPPPTGLPGAPSAGGSYAYSYQFSGSGAMSGSYMSGSYMSGSYKSGSYKSGSYKSGSYKSGSYMSGSYMSGSYGSGSGAGSGSGSSGSTVLPTVEPSFAPASTPVRTPVRQPVRAPSSAPSPTFNAVPNIYIQFTVTQTFNHVTTSSPNFYSVLALTIAQIANIPTSAISFASGKASLDRLSAASADTHRALLSSISYVIAVSPRMVGQQTPSDAYTLVSSKLQSSVSPTTSSSNDPFTLALIANADKTVNSGITHSSVAVANGIAVGAYSKVPPTSAPTSIPGKSSTGSTDSVAAGTSATIGIVVGVVVVILIIAGAAYYYQSLHKDVIPNREMSMQNMNDGAPHADRYRGQPQEAFDAEGVVSPIPQGRHKSLIDVIPAAANPLATPGQEPLKRI